MHETPQISIVSPVYRAENIVSKLVAEITATVSRMGLSYEIVLVDDRSPDNSWRVMQELTTQYKNLKCVRLSKNYGQHPAIIAGLAEAKGNWVVVMDCDLQDQPKEIVKLYSKAQEGFEIVLASRHNRQDSFIKKASSKLFSILYSYFTETKFDNSVANFGIYSKKVVDEVVKVDDYIKSFPLFVKLVGFRSTTVDVEHAERDSGTSSYSFSKLISLAFNTIISFSNKPLKLFVKFGLLMSVLSFVVGLLIIYKYFSGEITVLGYSSLILSIWFLSGIMITCIGVVGIYIGKIFDQTKGRKPYIIDEIVINQDL